MVPNEIVLISDRRVLEIPILESHDPLVDLREYTQLAIDTHKATESDSYFKLRKSVAEKLVEAQSTLPDGLELLVVECYRPLNLQKAYFDEYANELRTSHTEWSEQEIIIEASKFVAPPENIPPHCTGGAVDLTLSLNGVELNMGTELNADPENSNNACFTQATTISVEAKTNRQILNDALAHQGFVNYPTEWWHWSYGDRYWAYQTKHPAAIFGVVE